MALQACPFAGIAANPATVGRPRPEMAARSPVSRLSDLDGRKSGFESHRSRSPSARRTGRCAAGGVYGSVARGDDHRESDLDLLVSFAGEEAHTSTSLAVALSEETGRRVQVGSLSTVRRRLSCSSTFSARAECCSIVMTNGRR